MIRKKAKSCDRKRLELYDSEEELEKEESTLASQNAINGNRENKSLALSNIAERLDIWKCKKFRANFVNKICYIMDDGSSFCFETMNIFNRQPENITLLKITWNVHVLFI